MLNGTEMYPTPDGMDSCIMMSFKNPCNQKESDSQETFSAYNQNAIMIGT